jgi:hypothetical protein
VRDPYRAIEVAALEVVSEAHDASIPSARATIWFVHGRRAVVPRC